MKVYPITESDMLSLKLTTGLASLFLSFGWTLIGYAVDIYVSTGSDTITSANPMAKYVAPICVAAGILLVLGGAAASIGHWITWGRVKKNTQTINVRAAQ